MKAIRLYYHKASYESWILAKMEMEDDVLMESMVLNVGEASILYAALSRFFEIQDTGEVNRREDK